MDRKDVSVFRFFSIVSLLVAVLTILGTNVAAAEALYSDIPTDEFIKKWLVLGPIPAVEAGSDPSLEEARKSGFETDLLKNAEGEAKVAPKQGASIEIRGGQYAWKLISAKESSIDLQSAIGSKEFAIGYAAVEIDMSTADSRLVGLGSDDAVRVWLNGELVHSNFTTRSLSVDSDVFPVKLRKGKNRLLIKVLNEKSDWGFTCRFLSREGLADRLHQAAGSGNTDLIDKLLSYGVDINAKSPFGLTAVQIANMRGYVHTADHLVSKGAKKDEPFDPASVLHARLSNKTSKDGPGVSVLIARDGIILFSGGFGMANLSHDVPITTNTKFRIGSVTKQFASAAILKLQEEGKLRVQDKLSKFVSDFPRGDEVTIHHLLTHTSGIKSFTGKSDFYATVASAATSEQMIESFKNDKFDFDPGQKFAYNNSGYFLLGHIVEKVSGKSFESFLKETFFEPLEMHDTGVHRATALLKHEATGYSYDDGKISKALDWDMSRAGAAGNMYSTVEDLMRWNEGIFGGKVLTEESLKSAFTPVKLDSGEEPMMSYGYGWMIDEHRGLKRISHSGGLNGWLTQLTRYVDQNVTIAVFHNAMPPNPSLTPSGVANLMAEAFLWQEMPPRPKYETDKSVDPKTFAAYVGKYDYLAAVMEVTVEGDRLMAQLSGQEKYQIYPMGGTKFFWKVVDAQVEFNKDKDGNVVSARHTQRGQTFVAKKIKDTEMVKVDTKTLDLYTGKYSYSGLGVLAVRRDGDKLLAQMTGQPEFEIYASAKDKFFWKVVKAEIQFVIGDDGKVIKAIHKQAGASIDAKKIE